MSKFNFKKGTIFLKRFVYLSFGFFLVFLGIYISHKGIKNHQYYSNFEKHKIYATAQVVKKIKPVSKFQNSSAIVFIFKDVKGREFEGETHIPLLEWDNIKTTSFLKVVYNEEDPKQSMLPIQLKEMSKREHFWVRFIGGFFIILSGIGYLVIFRKPFGV